MGRAPFLWLAQWLLFVVVLGAGSSALWFGMPDFPGLHQAMSDQAGWILSQPLEIPGLLARTLAVQGEFWLTSFLGSFGALDTDLPRPLILLLWGLLLLALAVDALEGPGLLGWPVRVAVLAAGVAAFVGTLLALYVIWTSHIPGGGIGASLIQGVQGRYFIPVAPLVLVALAWTPAALARRAAPWLPALRQGLLVGLAGCLILTLFTLVLRYWVPPPGA